MEYRQEGPEGPILKCKWTENATIRDKGLKEAYGGLVYQLKKIVGSYNFSVQFIQIFFSLYKDWL